MKKEQWEEVSTRVRAILNYGIDQNEWLQRSRMARFIAAVPFLAGCDKALETSFVHLLVYLVALDPSARDLFLHKPEDDAMVRCRLSPLLSFSGGDQAVLRCCEDLLALCMVANYRKDAAADRAVGKYNPLNAGVWDAETLDQELTASIGKHITQEISAFFTVEEALEGYWDK